MKILVIEDEPEMRRNLTTILDSAKPLEKVLGLTPRVAETLLWLLGSPILPFRGLT